MTTCVEDTSQAANLRSFRGRTFATTQRFFVYRNVNSDCWSLRAMDGPDKGRVVARADSVALYNCQFVVSEAGRQRVLREGRKNVHAGIIGELAPEQYWIAAPAELKTQIYYNPWKTETFEVVGLPVSVAFASHVHLGTDGRVRATGIR